MSRCRFFALAICSGQSVRLRPFRWDLCFGRAVDLPGNPAVDPWPRDDTWVEVSIEGQTSRLHDGDEVTLGEYRVTLTRAFKDGIPGQFENAAISRDGSGLHPAVARAAGLLGKWNAGLTLTDW